MDKKIYRVEVRLNKKDYDKFEKIRLKAGLTKTHLIRNLINKIEIKERVSKDYFDVKRYLASVANNVNRAPVKG